jgi:hypothetical protein
MVDSENPAPDHCPLEQEHRPISLTVIAVRIEQSTVSKQFDCLNV